MWKQRSACFAWAWVVGAYALTASLSSRGAHPYITDDTNTQGTGHFELQLGAQFTRTSDSGTTISQFDFQPQLTSGLLDTLDLILRPDYSVQTTSGADSSRASGFGDTDLAVKWRFWTGDPWSMAVTLGSGMPSGNSARGLGSDHATPHASAIAGYSSAEFQSWFNAAVARPDQQTGIRGTVAHFSANALVTVQDGLQLGIDLATDQNPVAAQSEWLTVALAGVIWTLTPACDLDLGFQRGLSSDAPHHQWLLGVTLRW